MPNETDTTVLGLPYPTATNSGNNFAQGIADLANGLDGLISGALSDTFQPGVTTAAAGAVANPAVSGAGAVSLTGLTAGNVYILAAAGALVRNAVPTGSFSATPSLPASGKFATVGIDLACTTWGGTSTVVLSAKGSDQNTAALALANPPAVATGHYRLMNVVVLNTSGTYSLAASSDVRASALRNWAFALQAGTSSLTNTTVAVPAAACTVNFTLAAAGFVSVIGRAVCDKNAGTSEAIYAALLLDGAQVLNSRGFAASYVEGSGVSGNVPTVSALFSTGSAEYGISFLDVSGSGDYQFAGGSTPQLVGVPTVLYIPAGIHQLQWAFAIDPGGTYSVVSQQLGVHL